jgi:hypothetical protein
METYFIKSTEGYHFSIDGIKKIEDYYGGRFVGSFCTKRTDGSWNDEPVDVFYQPNPDFSKGHTHYFGMFRNSLTGHVMITNAISAFEHPMLGAIADDGEVIVSGYRHDYRRSKDGTVFIDGGRDYTRYGRICVNSDVDSVRTKLVQVKVVDGNLVAIK